MMEAASTSETLVNFYQTTRRNIPGESHLRTRRPKNLKSHKSDHFFSSVWSDLLKYHYMSPVMCVCVCVCVRQRGKWS
jgi:hypothetical protein